MILFMIVLIITVVVAEGVVGCALVQQSLAAHVYGVRFLLLMMWLLLLCSRRRCRLPCARHRLLQHHSKRQPRYM